MPIVPTSAGSTAWLTGPENVEPVRAVQSASTNPDLATFLRSPDGEAELLVVGLVRAPLSSRAHRVIERLRTTSTRPPPTASRHHVTGIAGLGADQLEAVTQSFDRTAIASVCSCS